VRSFLDEPTSGLDSYTANEVMTVVKNLIYDGVTVCATIHSPSQYCFNLFDRLMMLVKGRVVYFGTTGEAAPFATSICPKVRNMFQVARGVSGQLSGLNHLLARETQSTRPAGRHPGERSGSVAGPRGRHAPAARPPICRPSSHDHAQAT
jgi:ABC-type multidrug transport system ATPase subunit